MPSPLAAPATKAESLVVRTARLQDKLLTALKREREKNGNLLTYLLMQMAGARKGAAVDRQTVEPLWEDCVEARQTVERLEDDVGKEKERLRLPLHRLAVLLERLAKAGGSRSPYPQYRAALRKLTRAMP